METATRFGWVLLAFLVGCGGSAPLGLSAPSSDGGSDRLSQMGLYEDLQTRTIAPGVVEFEPAFPLWSDGATKRRWISLPPGTQIDTSDLDHWVFPIGAKLFKEFSMGETPVETRMIERTASGYRMAVFAWLADGSDAIETTSGAKNALGTSHDIPSESMCATCHQSEPGRVLGFSAIQLSKPEGRGPTLLSLAQSGLLSHPSASDAPAPGDVVTRSALGYLHGNCGHCHSPAGVAAYTGQFLRLNVADRSPEATPTWRTAVNVPLELFSAPGITLRIAPGDPDHSAIVYRMNHRGDAAQMPPIATTLVDPDGLAALRAWIQSL